MRWYVILPLLFLPACHDTPPGPEESGLYLSVDDVSCTSVWLRLRTPASSLSQRVDLFRDGVLLKQISITSSDTLFLDDGLLPRHSYTYQVERRLLIGLKERSESVLATTLDTTSHDFTWEVTTLGDGDPSQLCDVVIINDTLAYAVGAIYLRDSLGNSDPNAYNMVKWDGTGWTPLRIQFFTICGQSSRTPYRASSVIAFGGNNMWIAMDGSQVARWNGDAQTATMCLPISFSITELWGESPNSVYAVGDGGNIVQYFNGAWRKLESGTTLPIQDIWGLANPSSGVAEVYAVASNFVSIPSGKKLLRITGTNVTAMSDSGLNMFLNSIWFCSGSLYYIVGGGFFSSASISQSTIWQGAPNLVTNYYSLAIRGTASNDIFIVGGYGDVVHFNGSTWKSFHEQTAVTGNYWALAVKGNLVIAVGNDGGRAAVAIGRKL